MEILSAIILIFLMGYGAGVAVAHRLPDRRQQNDNASEHRCRTCSYCFEISQTTKDLMHRAYADKSGCLMCRGSTVPVGYNGSTISVVNPEAFCDQWKEREPDG